MARERLAVGEDPGPSAGDAGGAARGAPLAGCFPGKVPESPADAAVLIEAFDQPSRHCGLGVAAEFSSPTIPEGSRSCGAAGGVETTVGVLAAAAGWRRWRRHLCSGCVADHRQSRAAFLRRRRERRRRAGYRALTQGMVAVAAGDPQEARRFARSADALLADPPLTLLLSAQAAQLDGDETAAKNSSPQCSTAPR